MLEAHERTLAGERHAERLFHGGLFIGGPMAVYATLRRERMALNVFGYFCGGGTGICVYPAEAGMQCAQRQSFIPQ